MADGRRVSSVAARLVGFFLGVGALAAGVGLGLRHAIVEGLTPVAWAGLTLLLVGIVLTGWASVGLLASMRKRWWVLAVPAMVVSMGLGLLTVGQAVAASIPPRPSLGAAASSQLGPEAQEVEFRAADGVRLEGWYLPSANGAAVAVLHGAGSTRTAVLDQATVLADHGYGVLVFDARGHGTSAGSGMDFGWWGEVDAAAAVDFLLAQPDVTEGGVGLLGESMGGEEAIGAAGVDPRVRAVVAEGATNRVSQDKAFLEVYGVRGSVQRGLDRITYGLTELLSPAPRPGSLRDAVAVSAERAPGARFLLVTAGEVPDEGHAADYIAAAAPESVEIWTVDEAAHTGGLKTDPAGWEQRVTAFLDAALLGA